MRLNPLSCLKEYQYHLITGCKSTLLWLWIGATVMTFQPQFNTRSGVSLSRSLSHSLFVITHSFIFCVTPFYFCAPTLCGVCQISLDFSAATGYEIDLFKKKKKMRQVFTEEFCPFKVDFILFAFRGCLSVCMLRMWAVCACVCERARARCFVLLPFSQLYICHTISHTRLYLTYA